MASDKNHPALDRFRLRSNLGHLVRRSHQRVAALYALEIGRELPSQQFSVLLTVHQNPGLAQIDLIDRIGIDRSTVSALVQRLVRRGMLTRKRLRGNLRADSLFITEKGRTAVAEAIPGALRVHRRIQKILPPELLPGFVAALKVFADWPDGNGSAERAVARATRKRKKVRQR